jgi:hypothetical protein
MNRASNPLQIVEDINALTKFLARRDVEELSLTVPVDIVVLLGSSILQATQVASDAIHKGIADKVLVSGGVGHSTKDLWDNVRTQADLSSIEVEGRPESEILREVLIVRHAVPASAIIVENTSTNCGTNAWETKRVLGEIGISYSRLLLVQDPTMQRRTHASFERAWRGEPSIEFLSFAPFVPQAHATPDGDWRLDPEAWPRTRFLDLILGEIPRLMDDASGYGPKGRDFIEHVDIPLAVLEAHQRLKQVFISASRDLA